MRVGCDAWRRRSETWCCVLSQSARHSLSARLASSLSLRSTTISQLQEQSVNCIPKRRILGSRVKDGWAAMLPDTARLVPLSALNTVCVSNSHMWCHVAARNMILGRPFDLELRLMCFMASRGLLRHQPQSSAVLYVPHPLDISQEPRARVAPPALPRPALCTQHHTC